MNSRAACPHCGHAIIIKVSTEEQPAPPAPPVVVNFSRPLLRKPLTEREWEIAGLFADGLTHREIAEQLVLSTRTVDSHIDHIYRKLLISRRTELQNWIHARLVG